MTIETATEHLKLAKLNLVIAVKLAFPIGSFATYRRSPRCNAVRLCVVAHRQDTCIQVYNVDTGKFYWLNGTIKQLAPIEGNQDAK